MVLPQHRSGPLLPAKAHMHAWPAAMARKDIHTTFPGLSDYTLFCSRGKVSKSGSWSGRVRVEKVSVGVSSSGEAVSARCASALGHMQEP